MASEVRVSVAVEIDGRRHSFTERRIICDEVLDIQKEVAAGAESGDGDPLITGSGVATARVVFLQPQKPVTFYLGTNHTEGAVINAGGLILLLDCGVKADGPDLANFDEEIAAVVRGLIAGS